MRDKSEDVGHLRAGWKLKTEKGGDNHTVQGTVSRVAFSGADDGAEKAQTPKLNAQVKVRE
jgi:hypothetical protein